MCQYLAHKALKTQRLPCFPAPLVSWWDHHLQGCVSFLIFPGVEGVTPQAQGRTTLTGEGVGASPRSSSRGTSEQAQRVRGHGTVYQTSRKMIHFRCLR